MSLSPWGAMTLPWRAVNIVSASLECIPNGVRRARAEGRLAERMYTDARIDGGSCYLEIPTALAHDGNNRLVGVQASRDISGALWWPKFDVLLEPFINNTNVGMGSLVRTYGARAQLELAEGLDSRVLSALTSSGATSCLRGTYLRALPSTHRLDPQAYQWTPDAVCEYECKPDSNRYMFEGECRVCTDTTVQREL